MVFPKYRNPNESLVGAGKKPRPSRLVTRLRNLKLKIWGRIKKNPRRGWRDRPRSRSRNLKRGHFDCGLIRYRRCLSLFRRAGIVIDLASPQFGLPNGSPKIEQVRISKSQRLRGTSDHRLWLRYRTLLRHCGSGLLLLLSVVVANRVGVQSRAIAKEFNCLLGVV
jgi:hypothetical protein